jgi:hypothetical protein
MGSCSSWLYRFDDIIGYIFIYISHNTPSNSHRIIGQALASEDAEESRHLDISCLKNYFSHLFPMKWSEVGPNFPPVKRNFWSSPRSAESGRSSHLRSGRYKRPGDVPKKIWQFSWANLWGFLEMGDPQVTICFNTKSWCQISWRPFLVSCDDPRNPSRALIERTHG